MHPMLNIASQAALSAGKIIVRFVDRLDTITVDEKRRNDFVTEVDRLAEQEIIHVIRKAYPEHSILAEESGLIEGENRDFCWVIDPLDGTANFVHGFPQFAVSIGLKQQGEVILGAIYDPLRNELFTANKGAGAQLNNRKIRVSQCKKLESSLIGTGFPFRETHHFKPYLKTFEAIFPICTGIRRAGAAALDLAYVAAGRLDGFWEASLKEWDLAAGTLIIKEAGGLVGDFHGQDEYLDNGQIIAGNPKIYKALQEIIHTSLHV